ncbi:MAG TPA: VCBS repeat-containing protein, partial [Myxococcota bacterium]|nr:VCBS repeat-containing protein [Myxococcota bacterium]
MRTRRDLREEDPQSLLRRCERALREAGRAAGSGSRQQVRAAARSFVRRHRRNGSYLAFVLRSVLANSALAAVLLGFAPAPAQARSTLFLENTGTANPMNGQDVGILSTPAATDLDHDGDLDIVSGERYGTFVYYTNIGSATAPSYIIVPTIIVDVGDASAPAFGDLDHDGTDDELVGTAAGTFAYFGSNIFALNPMNGVDVGSYATPAFGDLDADGDLDLVVGEQDGVLNYFENVGSATVPTFVQRTGTANPFGALPSVGLFSAPAIADLDGDGDVDVVSGAGDGTYFYFENTGLPLAPEFVLRSGADNPLAGFDVGGRSTPVLGDFDGDGDADVLAGETYGTFKFYANQAGHFVLRSGAANPLSAIDVGDDSAPAFGDLDADGDLDIVSGDFLGQFHYLKNIGSVIAAVFSEQTGLQNPLGGFDVGSRSKPAIADIGFFTPDGKLDVSSGANDGTFHFYKNTGTASVAAFLEQTGSQTNPFYNEDVGANSAPALGDLDGFIPENVTGENFGTFLVSEPFSTFIALPPGLTGEDVGTYSTPSLGDTDGDGDLDLVAGEQSGVFNYYENIGDPLAPEFLLHSDARNPVAGQDIGFDSAPALGDLDGDGARDLVSGQLDGQFSFFKNVLIRPWPRYAGPSPIPFRNADVGYFSTPAS